MPAPASRRSSSNAAMRGIHRDREGSKSLAVGSSCLAPAKGRVAKKPSSASPLPPRRRAAPIPPSPAAGAPIRKDSAAVAPPSLPDPAAVAASATTTTTRQPSSLLPEGIKAGTTVRVRTPVGKVPTGQRLVIWLSAVVVSAAEDDDGSLRVVCCGKFPRDDPFRTVRVARNDVKDMPDAAAAAVVSAAPRPSTSGAKPAAAAPLPTVGGKSLPLLKKLEQHMRSRGQAFIAAC